MSDWRVAHLLQPSDPEGVLKRTHQFAVCGFTCPWWGRGGWSLCPDRPRNVWGHRRAPDRVPSHHHGSGRRTSSGIKIGFVFLNTQPLVCWHQHAQINAVFRVKKRRKKKTTEADVGQKPQPDSDNTNLQIWSHVPLVGLSRDSSEESCPGWTSCVFF